MPLISKKPIEITEVVHYACSCCHPRVPVCSPSEDAQEELKRASKTGRLSRIAKEVTCPECKKDPTFAEADSLYRLLDSALKLGKKFGLIK